MTRVRSFSDLLDRSFRYWALLPAVVLLAALTIYPMADLVRMSLGRIAFRGGRESWTFAPGGNFADLISDPVLVPALRNTLVFVAVAVTAEVVLGLALALLVARIPRGRPLLRTVVVLPILVPPVAIGSMWRLMYNFDFGIFNQALLFLGLGPVDWLGAPSLALLSVIVVDIWHWVPFVFLVLFAALEGVPQDAVEAALVDGANG